APPAPWAPRAPPAPRRGGGRRGPGPPRGRPLAPGLPPGFSPSLPSSPHLVVSGRSREASPGGPDRSRRADHRPRASPRFPLRPSVLSRDGLLIGKGRATRVAVIQVVAPPSFNDPHLSAPRGLRQPASGTRRPGSGHLPRSSGGRS